MTPGQGAGARVPVVEILDTGVHATLEDLARGKDMAPSYVSRVLRLTLLAPGHRRRGSRWRQPAELQLDDTLEGFPLAWKAQPGGWDHPWRATASG
jgi:hypothetical protein